MQPVMRPSGRSNQSKIPKDWVMVVAEEMERHFQDIFQKNVDQLRIRTGEEEIDADAIPCSFQSANRSS